MRTILLGFAATALLATTAMAQPSYDQQQQYQAQHAQYEAQRDQYHHEMHEWARGSVVPREYFSDRYYVDDWQVHHLHAPRPGYRWVRDDHGNYFLAAIETGVIDDLVITNHY